MGSKCSQPTNQFRLLLFRSDYLSCFLLKKIPFISFTLYLLCSPIRILVGNRHEPKEVFLVTCIGVLLSSSLVVGCKHFLVNRFGTLMILEVIPIISLNMLEHFDL